MTSHPTTAQGRLASGIPGLDTVLNGGLLSGGTYIVMGLPGTGKTILGNQLCFNHVAKGGEALFITLLAESHSRMLMHMRTLSFMNEDVVGRDLNYLSAYTALEGQGLNGLLSVIRKALQEKNASLLVIDGLVSASVAAPSPIEFKKFIHSLQVAIEMLDCTAVLLTNPSPQGGANTEHTMVDGVIELTDQLLELRPFRELEIRKLRGSPFLRGRHTVDINSDGITVYPRLETRYASALGSADVRTSDNPVSFGISRLDDLFHGGLEPGSTTVLLGGPGTGKTLLGLNFLADGAKNQERCLYYGFREHPVRLLRKAERISLSLQPHIDAGNLVLHHQSSLDGSLDMMGNHILDTVRVQGVHRIFIDGINDFRNANVQPARLQRFLTALTNELTRLGCTAILTGSISQIGSYMWDFPGDDLPDNMDNIVAIQLVKAGAELFRLLNVLKEFAGSPDRMLRELTISDRGLHVASSEESAEAILRKETHGD